MVLLPLAVVPGLTSHATPPAAPSAAAGRSADGSSLLPFLSEKKQGGLVLQLLAAAATGRPLDRVEVDAPPALRITNDGVLLEVLEAKLQPSGESWAVVTPHAGRVEACTLLVTSCASLLAPRGSLPVHCFLPSSA